MGSHFRRGMRRSVRAFCDEEVVRTVKRLGKADAAGIGVVEIEIGLEEFFVGCEMTSLQRAKE